MLTLAHQNLLILGLGDSGLAMAQWGVFCGANVWVADNREDPPQLQALRRELPRPSLCVRVWTSSSSPKRILMGSSRVQV